MKNLSELPGARVVLVHNVDRYPHFMARAGMTGTVTDRRRARDRGQDGRAHRRGSGVGQRDLLGVHGRGHRAGPPGILHGLSPDCGVLVRGSQTLAVALRPGSRGWVKHGREVVEGTVTAVYRTNVAVCFKTRDGRDVIVVVPVVDTVHLRQEACFSLNRR